MGLIFCDVLGEGRSLYFDIEIKYNFIYLLGKEKEIGIYYLWCLCDIFVWKLF